MTRVPTSFLAFRNGSIGNTLAAVPALRALHHSFPSVPISVVVDLAGYALLEHCPWINRLIIYEKHGRDRSLAAHLRLLRELRGVKPSHAILFKRFFRNGLLAYLSGARVRAGFVTEGRAPFLNLTLPYDETISVAELNLKLVELLGAHSTGTHYELFLSEEDEKTADHFLVRHKATPQHFTVVHYGGLTTPPDFLPLSQFAELLSRVTKTEEPLFAVGAGESEQLSAANLQRILPQVVSVVGLPLRVTAALMKRARLFVGLNSGPAHLAAAAGTPALVIFKPGHRCEQEIRKWLPPTPLAAAVVPPVEADHDACRQFFSAATETARRLVEAAAPR